MKFNFFVNDYMLAWNLLFQPSITEWVANMKKRIWSTYQRQYKDMQEDHLEIIKEQKNYIPNDNTLYEYVFRSPIYESLKKGTEDHRLLLMKVWDDTKKKILEELKSILRFNSSYEYNVLIVHPLFDTTLYQEGKDAKTLVIGRRIDVSQPLKTVMEMIHYALKNELNYAKTYNDIVDAVLELAIQNEMYTKLSDNSQYQVGAPVVKQIKQSLYPYWLMYLGTKKEDMLNCMMRDKIVFDIDLYEPVQDFSKYDLRKFIDFCISKCKIIEQTEEIEVI